MRDFLMILQTHRYFEDSRWNRSDFRYTFETGSVVEFFSADQPSKVRGPRRDRLFINEANNISYEAFDQLEVRTKEFVIMDWNPVSEFYFNTEIQGKRTDVEHIILTYKDNEALPKSIRDSIEQRRGNERWWRVYGLGLLGESEGRIFTGWNIIDSIPHEARLERRGLDFGYTSDPSALVAVYRYNGGFIVDEEFYLKGMSNKMIADRILLAPQPTTLVVADSSEPKSIEEIRLYGVNIIGADKGKGSVSQGIQFIQDQKISITKRSVNGIKEYRSYSWMKDREGRQLNVPEGGFDHCFSPETLVKTIFGYKPIKELEGKTGYLFSRDGRICRFHSVRKTRHNVETVRVEFDTGEVLEVTEDHLLLAHDGTWVEAGLLAPSDLIQSDMHDRNYLRDEARIWWLCLQKICRRTLLQSESRSKYEVPAQVCVGTDTRANTADSSHTPQEPQPVVQLYLELGDGRERAPSQKPLYGREKGGAPYTSRRNPPAYQEVARVKRGEEVALVTWKERVCQTKTIRETVRSLPCKIYNNAIRRFRSFLSSELQNESPSKKVKRITRGFSAITYNLEVDETHCLVANGVIAHNCLDSLRYAMSSISPVEAKVQTDYVHEEPETMYNEIGI